MSEFVLFPKWKYSQVEPARIVHSVEEEEALEGDWRDSPAFFKTSGDDENAGDWTKAGDGTSYPESK